MVDSEVVWQWQARLAQRSFDDETVIIGLDANEVHLLNESASFLWQQLESGANLNELSNKLQTVYEVDLSQANQDVSAYIEMMQEKGLIVPNPAPPGSSR